MIRRPDSVVQHKFDRDITRSTINSPLLRFPAISNIHARTREIARAILSQEMSGVRVEKCGVATGRKRVELSLLTPSIPHVYKSWRRFLSSPFLGDSP